MDCWKGFDGVDAGGQFRGWFVPVQAVSKPAYLLTIVWALIAIVVRQPQADWVLLTAGIGVAALVFMLVRFRRAYRMHRLV